MTASSAGFYADAHGPVPSSNMSVSAKRQEKRRSHRPSDRYRVKSGVPAALNVNWLELQINEKHTPIFVILAVMRLFFVFPQKGNG